MIVYTSITGEILYAQGSSYPHAVGNRKAEEKKQINQKKERLKKETQSRVDTQRKCLKKIR
ncbi:MAG: hypothetical protein ACMUEL_05380 [Flavobacteriales bacterium Tduv]